MYDYMHTVIVNLEHGSIMHKQEKRSTHGHYNVSDWCLFVAMYLSHHHDNGTCILFFARQFIFLLYMTLYIGCVLYIHVGGWHSRLSSTVIVDEPIPEEDEEEREGKVTKGELGDQYTLCCGHIHNNAKAVSENDGAGFEPIAQCVLGRCSTN